MTDPRTVVIACGIYAAILLTLGFLGLYLTGHSTVFGLHAGVIGVVANYLTAMASRRLDRRAEIVQ